MGLDAGSNSPSPHPSRSLWMAGRRSPKGEGERDAEAELLARCRRGEAEAWDELFERHYAAAGRFIFQLGHDLTREDAEEICQEAFLAVIKNIDSFHGQSQFQTWLFRIAANKARDYRQRLHAAKRGGRHITVPLDAPDQENGL